LRCRRWATAVRNAASAISAGGFGAYAVIGVAKPCAEYGATSTSSAPNRNASAVA